MRDLNDKISGGNLTANEWNDLPSEVQNVIEDTAQTLTAADLNQLGKGIAQYIANGDFYTDSGAANAYVLTAIGLKQVSPAYVDGMRVRFIPGNANTIASTVNVGGLGVKNITNTATAGRIVATAILELTYKVSSGEFEITNIILDNTGVATILTLIATTFTATNATITDLIVESLDDRSAFRLHGLGFAGGVYIRQDASNGNIDIAKDAEHNGTAWVARGTSASIITFNTGGGFNFKSNTGLTIGNTFVPTDRFNIGNDGKVIAGGVPADITGATGSYTTASINAGSSDTRIVSHTLSTDDLIMSAAVSSSNTNWLLSYKMFNGWQGKAIGPNAASLDAVATPGGLTAGNMGFTLKNTSGGAAVFTVQWEVRLRT